MYNAIGGRKGAEEEGIEKGTGRDRKGVALVIGGGEDNYPDIQETSKTGEDISTDRHEALSERRLTRRARVMRYYSQSNIVAGRWSLGSPSRENGVVNSIVTEN